MVEQQNTPQQEGGNEYKKVEGQFNGNFKKLVALMQGESNLKKTKVPKDDVSEVITELLAERKKTAKEKLKKDAITLLDKYAEYQKKAAEAKAEYEKKIIADRKSFIKEMEEVFKQVDDMQNLEKSYYEAFKVAAGDEVVIIPVGE